MPVNVEREIETARRFYGAGDYVNALSALLRIPEELRHDTDFLLLYGACLCRRGRNQKAREVLGELLAAEPDCHEALTWMAWLESGTEAGLDIAQRAIGLKPQDAVGYSSLGTCYLKLGRFDEAVDTYRKAIERNPAVVEYRQNLALALISVHQHHEAIAELERCIAISPETVSNYLTLANIYVQFGLVGAAFPLLQEAVNRAPNEASLHTALAGAFSLVRNDAAAERHHLQAIQLSAASRSSYASWLQNQGRFDEATTIFEALNSENSDQAFATYSLVNMDRYSGSAHDLTTLANRSNRDEMFAAYARGRFHDRHAEYEIAIQAYDRANVIACDLYQRPGASNAQRFLEEHRQSVTMFEEIPESGSCEESPIFIVGMIRSGTTLLDQILTSHPDVGSGGELRFWMEESQRLSRTNTIKALDEVTKDYVGYARMLAGDSHRFTDKMPLNFANIGLIHRALPKARFLHIRRQPADVCLSIWMTYFGQGPVFAYDKRQIVDFYQQYLRTMEYWTQNIPSDRLMDLDYESLVHAPDRVIPAVLDFCDLDWNDACLRHDQNTSTINTPSRWQARQPIYRTSIERWKRYEAWLGAFAELV